MPISIPIRIRAINKCPHSHCYSWLFCGLVSSVFLPLSAAAVVISICDSLWPSFTLRAKTPLPEHLSLWVPDSVFRIPYSLFLSPIPDSGFPSCIFIIIVQSLAYNLHKSVTKAQQPRSKNERSWVESGLLIQLNKFQFCAHVTAN